MKHLNILVVDDDPTSLLMVAKGVAAANHQVKTAEKGTEAVRYIAEEFYDVVITDLMMPGVDGIGVLETAKARNSRTDVLLLTAHGSIQSAVEAMKKGATDYLQKPVNLHELLMRLDRIASFREASESAEHLREAMSVTERNASQTIQDLEMEVTRLSTMLSAVRQVFSKLGLDAEARLKMASDLLSKEE
jgi:two-component system, OmpR family, response regulator